MDIQVLTQPKLSNGESFSLGESIISILTSKKPKYKTANFIFGVVRPNALEYLKPYFTTFIENKGKINFYVDANKRTSSNNLLNELISIGINVYVYDSDDITEFQYRGCFFEAQKKADVFLTSGNFSLNGLCDSINIVTHIDYDLNTDKEDYDEFKNSILSPEILSNFHEAQQSPIDYFEDDTYVKSYADPIPSISEFTGKESPKKSKKKKTTAEEAESSIQIEIDDDVDFLVPTETPKEEKKEEHVKVAPQEKKVIDKTPVLDYPTETIYYNTDSALDVENFLFENKKTVSIPSSRKTTDLPIQEEPENEEEIPKVKSKILPKSSDISKTAIFMFEVSKVTKKGVCAGEIKIPVYLRDSIALFWDWPTKYNLNGEHSKIKSRLCKFVIIDTNNPNKKITDKSVKLFQREDESSFSIHSSELEKLDLGENDIIRLIKTQEADDSFYTCEVVRTDSKEYAIWEQFCTQEMKNSKRKYGIM